VNQNTPTAPQTSNQPTDQTEKVAQLLIGIDRRKAGMVTPQILPKVIPEKPKSNLSG
jgi:hypothetical protein